MLLPVSYARFCCHSSPALRDVLALSVLPVFVTSRLFLVPQTCGPLNRTPAPLPYLAALPCTRGDHVGTGAVLAASGGTRVPVCTRLGCRASLARGRPRRAPAGPDRPGRRPRPPLLPACWTEPQHSAHLAGLTVHRRRSSEFVSESSCFGDESQSRLLLVP